MVGSRLIIYSHLSRNFAYPNAELPLCFSEIVPSFFVRFPLKRELLYSVLYCTANPPALLFPYLGPDRMEPSAARFDLDSAGSRDSSAAAPASISAAAVVATSTSRKKEDEEGDILTVVVVVV